MRSRFGWENIFMKGQLRCGDGTSIPLLAVTYPTPLKSFHKSRTGAKLNKGLFCTDDLKAVAFSAVSLDDRWTKLGISVTRPGASPIG